MRQSLPRRLKLLRIPRLRQAVEQRLHQPGVGVLRVGLPRFQAVAQGHQFIDFGDDAVLFLPCRQPNINFKYVGPSDTWNCNSD